jgi:aspartate carbamoyltransferase catalytic subunit
MKLHHIIQAQQFNRTSLDKLFSVASEMEQIVEKGSSDMLTGRYLVG